ncbi:hypothetical protein D3C72_1926510 [compost metagenome]
MAVKQSRQDARNRMRFPDQHVGVLLPQTGDLCRQRVVIRLPVVALACRHVIRRRSPRVRVERLATERLGRTERCGGLPRIQAAAIPRAVHVDHVARVVGLDHASALLSRKCIEPL